MNGSDLLKISACQDIIRPFQETDSELTVETKVQQALIEIAANMTTGELASVGYGLKELLQSCAIDSQPCNYDT